ncbi:MAG: MBOAT family protein [Pseudomonadota bacterium]
MLFNSSQFLLFFALFFPTYWLLQSNLKYRNTLLLIGSYVFYGSWDWRFLSLIMLSTVVDFYVGRQMTASGDDRKRKRLLMVSLCVNLGILGVFKYLGFFVNSFVDLLQSLNLEANYVTLNIILPVGISFYTFQTLSYTIDIYRRKMEPSKSLLDFATFVAFFPQLVAGPIERAKALLPQIETNRKFSFTQLREGAYLVLWGLTKKCLIADRLAVYVDAVFTDPGAATGPQTVIAVFFFSIQIYCDFSGYSDIARGIAKMLGIELMVNFNTPYLSRSIKEFWSRWHISLSTWFRDYVYIPLGGNREGEYKTRRNLFITFVVSGLWHGANYTFLIWGFLHASGQLIETEVNNYASAMKLPPFLGTVTGFIWTFTFVNFCWIFFRAENISDAFIVINNCVSAIPVLLQDGFSIGMESLQVAMSRTEFVLSIYFVILLFCVDFFLKDRGIENVSSNLYLPVRWVFSWFLLVNFLMLAPSDTGSFIYFQF